jgi:hypothetical protein
MPAPALHYCPGCRWWKEHEHATCTNCGHPEKKMEVQQVLSCTGWGCPLTGKCATYRDPNLPKVLDVVRTWLDPIPYDVLTRSCRKYKGK